VLVTLLHPNELLRGEPVRLGVVDHCVVGRTQEDEIPEFVAVVVVMGRVPSRTPLLLADMWYTLPIHPLPPRVCEPLFTSGSGIILIEKAHAFPDNAKSVFTVG
jgi:hypothetical protein